ncbi:curli production assembly/transport component CsgF [Halanaerobium saccharolyticum]|uniref:Curli production assembly/transport component CsgF n=1 Tax=Halanaerobium saccharolyticum TaxID=43595 RepID=A0A4R6LRX9_9FIRM|nr:curli assembly protein CsgF [Halanaerobium saccharolyticum]TDO91275.1 curli production assembly/transport component CsgF [Halanaerobium saccharolyticum]
MRRNKIIILTLVTILFWGGFASVQASQYTMSWSFRTFNNPNARQVAINTAEKQDGLVEEDEDPIERFKESFERRLMSTMQRELIDQITGEESVIEKSYQTENLDISVIEEPNGDVTLTITDLNTGETSIVTYSADDYYY